MKTLFLTIMLAPFSYLASQSSNTDEDSTIYLTESAIVEGNKYNAILHTGGFILLKGRKDTIAILHETYFSLKFEDLNKDGFKDLFLDKGGNTPERYDLFVYTPHLKKFKQILNFDMFPAPIMISGTKYFYSYHKNGCADLNWVSELFFIDNFKTIRIGRIDGVGCGSDRMPTAIYIYKLNEDNKKLLKTLPITTVDRFKEIKWGYIEDYWKKNYGKFIGN